MNEKELPEFAVCPLDALEIDGPSPCRAIDIAVEIASSSHVLCGCARHGTRWLCRRLPEGIWDQPRKAALFHSADAGYKLPSNYDEDADGAPCSEAELRRALGVKTPHETQFKGNGRTTHRFKLPGGGEVEYYGLATPKWTPEAGEPTTIRLRSIAAMGDVLYASAIAAAVKRRRPRTCIIFETAHPELAKDNPNIDEVVILGAEFEPDEQLIELREEFDWQPRKHRLVHFAEMAGVPIGDVEFFVPWESVDGMPDRYTALHAGITGVPEWIGRNWIPDRWHALAAEISGDMPIVAVGTDKAVPLPANVIDLRGQTTVSQTAGVIKGAHTFVGIESFPSTVAQAFGVPSVLFYGSILPELRAFRENVSFVRASGLGCLGCHHDEPGPAVTTICRAGGQPCQAKVSVDQFAAAVREAIREHAGKRAERLAIPKQPPVDAEPTVVFEVTHGMAYQADRTQSVQYGEDYFDKYVAMRGTEIANRINDARTALTEKYCTRLLDIGIGAGEFIERSKLPTLGFDVNAKAVAWLKHQGRFYDPFHAGALPADVDGVTLWDVLEHMPEPDEFLKLVRSGVYIFVSIPVFEDIKKVKESKHYRPNEHYWYFTAAGFIDFMASRGFEVIERSNAETEAGRDAIGTFVFMRRRDHVPPPPAHGRPLKIRTLNGFGDLCWLMVAIGNFKKQFAIPKLSLDLHIADDCRDHRAVEFIRRFSDVDEVEQSRFRSQTISYEAPRFDYIPNGTDDTGRCGLVPNGWLEWEGRLEDWLPWAVPKWDILTDGDFYRIDPKDAASAGALLASGQLFGKHLAAGCICVYLCSKANNSECGQNIGGVWSLDEWRQLLLAIRRESDLPIYVIGASEDAEYAAELMAVTRDVSGLQNICSNTSGPEVIELLRGASLLISFPSGLAVAATYMGTPTVCFWNPAGRSVFPNQRVWFSDAFATNWVPKESLDRGLYQPVIYGKASVTSVLEAAKTAVLAARRDNPAETKQCKTTTDLQFPSLPPRSPKSSTDVGVWATMQCRCRLFVGFASTMTRSICVRHGRRCTANSRICDSSTRADQNRSRRFWNWRNGHTSPSTLTPCRERLGHQNGHLCMRQTFSGDTTTSGSLQLERDWRPYARKCLYRTRWTTASSSKTHGESEPESGWTPTQAEGDRACCFMFRSTREVVCARGTRISSI